MSQWTKRRGAGIARGILIPVFISVLLLALYVSGILDMWLGSISWGIGMFFQVEFYGFLIAMIIIIGLISLMVRSSINWGGA